MHRFVAIKILNSKYLARQDLVSRFFREARAMSHLTHPNTARVFLCGELPDGACYFVMEYLEGRNLSQTVLRDGPMKVGRAVGVIIQVCGALAEAHRMGIIHRDLKPENILLTQQGGIRDYPKVLDFGLAKVTRQQMSPGSVALTQQGMVFGTPEFMSPEQARGETLDARSDIYSLAIVLYELITGKLPFEGKQPVDFIRGHLEKAPIPVRERRPEADCPPKLDAIILRGLAKKADERYASAERFAEALAPFTEGELIPQDLQTPQRTKKSRQTRKALAKNNQMLWLILFGLGTLCVGMLIVMLIVLSSVL